MYEIGIDRNKYQGQVSSLMRSMEVLRTPFQAPMRQSENVQVGPAMGSSSIRA